MKILYKKWHLLTSLPVSRQPSSDPQTLAEPHAILACSMFVPAFRHCFAAPKVSPDHPSGERNSRLCISASLGFISRPKVCAWFISIAKGCILRLSPPDAFIMSDILNRAEILQQTASPEAYRDILPDRWKKNEQGQ